MLVKRIARVLGFLLSGSGLLYLYWAEDYLYPLMLLGGGAVLLGYSFFKVKEKANLNMTSFINVFTHFRVALDSETNVFQALSAALTVTSGKLYELLEELVNSLSHDHSVTPFISFAKPFKNRFITHIMINVYMLINHGIDHKRLWQFNYMFETLVAEYHEEQLALHESSYERYNTALFIGSGILIFTLMSSIFSLLGGI